MGQDPLSAAVPLTNATLPAAAARVSALVGLTSGVGRFARPEAPPSCTRKYPPAGMVPLSSATDHELPVVDAYWIDVPARLTAVVPRLCSSTKSLLYVAVAVPPPP